MFACEGNELWHTWCRRVLLLHAWGTQRCSRVPTETPIPAPTSLLGHPACAWAQAQHAGGAPQHRDIPQNSHHWSMMGIGTGMGRHQSATHPGLGRDASPGVTLRVVSRYPSPESKSAWAGLGYKGKQPSKLETLLPERA